MYRFVAGVFILPLLLAFGISEYFKRNPSSGMTPSSGAPKLHVGPYEVVVPAFLYVAAEPGELASDEEFNDWYDNEHVPIRLGHIPEFLAGARYQAVDQQKPRFSAVYDISDYHLFSQEKYTALRANRSPREAELVKRFAALDRRTCKTIYDSGRTSFAAKDTAAYITTLYISPPAGQEKDLEEWFKGQYVAEMRKIPGWKRTSLHEVVDSLLTSATASPKSNSAAKYLAVNEWADETFFTSDKPQQTLSTPEAQSLTNNGTGVETRQWKLYRAWDNTAKQLSNRLKPAYPAPGTSEIGDKVRARRGVRGLTPLDGALLNAPEIANGWNTLLGAVRTKNSLPADIREIIILRVAARNDAAYEWIHHEHVGADAGLTMAQLVRIRDLSRPAPSVSAPSPFSPLQAAALAFADASTRFSRVPDRVYANLRNELEKQVPSGSSLSQQLAEAAAVAATYNMVSRFLVATDVADHANVMVPFPAVENQYRTILADNGATLNVFVGRHPEEAKKPWIVFVNSLLTDLSMWEGVIARFSADYNVVAYDQRGHGRSSVPPKPCTIPQLADDIDKILGTLGIPTPIKAVIGISQGGATTLAFAIQHPDKYEKIVACDTQIKSPEANKKAWDDRIEHALAHGMEGIADITLPRWFPGGSPYVKGAKENVVRTMIENTKLDGFIAGARALQNYDLSTGLPDALTGKKTLLIAGEKDGKLPEGLKKLATDLQGEGKDVSFFQVPNAGHLPVFQDAGLEEWLEAVESFLRS